MDIRDNGGLGRIAVRSVPLPETIHCLEGTYTWTGKVFISYRMDDDPEIANWINLAVLDDDGGDFREIYSGVISPKPGSNGLRWMMFRDNRRILTGDYVLECEPSIDSCESVNILPLHFPGWLIGAKDLLFHWSEIIVSPDNRYIGWTTLGGGFEGVYLGRFRREQDGYYLDDVKNISTPPALLKDPEHDGCILPVPIRGGEVKQFIRGGSAISLVGVGFGIAGPIIQELDGEGIIPCCRTPGYDETLMLSPDEKLGIVMSTRFSPQTSFEIIGLLPRPHMARTLMGLVMPVYNYAVRDVRSFRPGNIGPALISMEQDRLIPGYMGIDLHDRSGEWIYCSPLSWHPDSRKAMWNEVTRPLLDSSLEGKNMSVKKRIRIVELLNKEPAVPVPPVSIRENIPYAVNPENIRSMTEALQEDIRISGNYSGSFDLKYLDNRHITRAVYENYSDDGRTFWNGTESVLIDKKSAGTIVYEADIQVSGEHEGYMKLRLTFKQESINAPVAINKERASDGKPLSYGEASYDGRMLFVNDTF